MLETRWKKRPSCAQLLARSQSWRLSTKEIQTINEFNTSLEIIRKNKQNFFYTFLLSKIDLRLSDQTCAGDQTDGPMIACSIEEIDGPSPKIENEQVQLKIGDIIQITDDGEFDVVILWALYAGGGFVLYLKPIDEIECNYRLLREKVDVITQNRTFVVNNLDEFAQTRGLTAQKPNDIQRRAEKLFEKYSNIDLNDSNHNLRIHFVTKCRYGRGICPKKDSLEEEITIFQI